MIQRGRRPAGALAGAALAGATLALAACGGAASSDRPDAAAAGELLLASPPTGWEETAALRTPVLRMAEYGPPGASTEGLDDEAAGAAAIERITLEAQGGSPLPDPIEFVLSLSRDLAKRCTQLDDVNISSGLENGYRTSVRLTICPRFRELEQAEISMVKAIQGNERFYVISRRLRLPPIGAAEPPLDAQTMAEWTTFLKRVTLCDTRGSDHPCPVSG